MSGLPDVVWLNLPGRSLPWRPVPHDLGLRYAAGTLIAIAGTMIIAIKRLLFRCIYDLAAFHGLTQSGMTIFLVELCIQSALPFAEEVTGLTQPVDGASKLLAKDSATVDHC